MKRTALYIFLTVLTVISAYGAPVKSINSPDGNLKLSFHLDENGVPCYSVDYKQKPIILTSKLGLETTKSKDEYAVGFNLKNIQTSAAMGAYCFFAVKPEVNFDFDVAPSEGQLVLWQ